MNPPATTRRYSGRYGALLLLPTGLLGLAAGIGAPILMALSPDGAGDVVLFVLLAALPALAGGVLALVNGLAAAATRITLSPAGVAIRAPTWRAAPLPPMQRLDAPWPQVTAVRRRIEVYRLWIVFALVDFPVTVYQVRAGAQRVTLGGRIVLRLPRAMRETAEAAGCPIVDDGPVRARLWHSLRRGPPAWAE